MIAQHTILLVEQNRSTRQFLADQLRADGYEMLVADSHAKGMALLRTGNPDLILADINGQTLGLLDAIRSGEGLGGEVDPDLPMIILTADAGEVGALTRVRALQHEGDDVISKPFSYPELALRVAAVLRRRGGEPRRRLRVGTLSIDTLGRTARVDGEPVELTAMEFELLRTLASDPTRVFTRQELLRDVWGYRCQSSTRRLDSHACRLRRKLEQAGVDREVILNVWGVGYRFSALTGREESR